MKGKTTGEGEKKSLINQRGTAAANLENGLLINLIYAPGEKLHSWTNAAD